MFKERNIITWPLDPATWLTKCIAEKTFRISETLSTQIFLSSEYQYIYISIESVICSLSPQDLTVRIAKSKALLHPF